MTNGNFKQTHTVYPARVIDAARKRWLPPEEEAAKNPGSKAAEDFIRATQAKTAGGGSGGGGGTGGGGGGVGVGGTSSSSSSSSSTLGSDAFFDGYILDAFLRKHGGDWRYVAQWGRWLRWDGKRWKRDEVHRVRALLTDILSELAAATNRKAAASRVPPIEKLLQSRSEIARTSGEWDADPWLLNTQSGTVNLKTGKEHAHRREDHITKICGVDVGKAIACPKWLDFLNMVTNDDRKLQGYMQRFSGYCLTGLVGEHVLGFPFGEGRNGKSTFLNVLLKVLGDYAGVVPAEMFMEDKHSRHPTELASLQGLRLAVANEIKKNAKWDDARIKQLTGGDPITARFMRQDFFTFEPTHKLLIAGNNQPRLGNVDEAMRHRLHLLPFIVRIPESVRILDYHDKLSAEEGPAILAWMIEGCRVWQRDGLEPPPVVVSASNAYFEQQDLFRRWLEDCCEVGGEHFGISSVLYGSWKDWCGVRGEHPGTETSFGLRLGERGFPAGKRRDVRGRSGLHLKPFKGKK